MAGNNAVNQSNTPAAGEIIFRLLRRGLLRRAQNVAREIERRVEIVLRDHRHTQLRPTTYPEAYPPDN
jgi:hypothetical protein